MGFGTIGLDHEARGDVATSGAHRESLEIYALRIIPAPQSGMRHAHVVEKIANLLVEAELPIASQAGFVVANGVRHIAAHGRDRAEVLVHHRRELYVADVACL